MMTQLLHNNSNELFIKDSGECFDRSGKQISREECRRLHNDLSYQQVATTELDDGIVISTVWLGYVILYGPIGPMIFETIVFDPEYKETQTFRYASEKEAMNHHKYLVDLHYDEHKPIDRWKQVLEEL